METLPSGLPEQVGDEENLARFLTQSNHFNAVMVRPAALLPNPRPVLFFLNMMGNVVGQLNPQGPRSPLSILWLVLVAMDLLPALLYFIVILLAYQNSEITLTNKRLIYRTGFVARAAGELPLENVEAIFILEPLLGRLLGYGTVTVSSNGGLRLPLQYLAKPQVFRAALQRAVTQAKSPARPAPRSAPVHQDDSRYMPHR